MHHRARHAVETIECVKVAGDAVLDDFGQAADAGGSRAEAARVRNLHPRGSLMIRCGDSDSSWFGLFETEPPEIRVATTIQPEPTILERH